MAQAAQEAAQRKGGSHEWLCPELWAQYSGAAGRALYRSFSEEELPDILRRFAEKAGRNPSQGEIFCVYRRYIRERLGSWPKALERAGLRVPKKQRYLQSEQGEERL